MTGGAGFIGSNFLNLLVPENPNIDFTNLDALTYAANLDSLAAVQDLPNYSFVKADIAEAPQITSVIHELAPDWIIHFAAESHVDRSIVSPGEFIRTNVVGTYNLLQAARELWGDRTDVLFHHVSTDEVFGSLGDEGKFSEETPYDPSSPYSASKASSDHIVRAFHRTYGMPVKITNCSNNYGPRQFPEKLIPLMILNALEDKPLPVYGTGLNVRDWLYVDDHCRAIWLVANKGVVGETYCVGGNNDIQNIQVVRQICTGVTKHTRNDAEKLITYVKDRPGHDHRYAIDTTKIHRDLGWQPEESFETGLQKTVDWYINNPAWIERVRSGAYREWMLAQYGQETSKP